MEKFVGKTIFGGIAIGKISFYSKDLVKINRKKITHVQEEIDRFEIARTTAIEQLNQIRDKAVKEVGEINASVFSVHAMMLEDGDFIDSVKNIIESQKVNAEYAVATTGDNFSNMFKEMKDEYFSARAIDILDISGRVVDILSGKSQDNHLENESIIIVANDLAPSETVQMDKKKVKAFVTECGSQNSHTAILARTMNIPAIIGIKVQKEWNNLLAIVDGINGKFIIEPDNETMDKYIKQLENINKERELLEELKGKEDITIDGTKVLLYANIGSAADVSNVIKNDARGIGLFRSEFLYLETDSYPDENQQFQAYKSVVENMAGKKVIIRTLDIGADKQIEYFNLDKEENPAMGYRAIRICLDRREIFKTQLRAIYRASAFGNVAIMFPMIISLNEIREIKQIIGEVKEELNCENFEFKEIELGVMIETPAAVMISDLLAKELDFFSIGTNDLTQYTLAIDRQNEKLDKIYDSHHIAIQRMIKMVVENGHKSNCMVGICGELAADLELTEEFIKIGVDELSVSPTFILPIRKKIREINLTKERK